MKNTYGYLKNIYRYDTHAGKSLIYRVSELSMPGPFYLSVMASKSSIMTSGYILSLSFSCGLLMISRLFSTMNLMAALRRPFSTFSTAKRSVSTAFCVLIVCVWGGEWGVSSYRSSGRSNIDRFCGWFKFLNIKGTWQWGEFSGGFCRNLVPHRSLTLGTFRAVPILASNSRRYS